MLTGFTTTVVGGRTQINQGNPDLSRSAARRSTPAPSGPRATARFDVTRVPDGREGSVHLERRDQQSAAAGSDRRLGRATGWTRTSAVSTSKRSSASAAASACSPTPRTTSTRKERLASGAEQDILNVPLNTVRAGVDVDFGRAQRARVGPLRAGPEGQRLQRAGLPDRRLRRLHRRRRERDVPARATACGRRWRSTTCSTRSTTRSSAIRCRARRSSCRTGSGSETARDTLIARSPVVAAAAARSSARSRCGAPQARRARLPANVTKGCVDRFDAATDYFPDKVTIEDAANFSVEYRRSYKVVTVAAAYAGRSAGALRARAVRRAGAELARRSGRRAGRHRARSRRCSARRRRTCRCSSICGGWTS